jgi:hypothetical protein
MQVSAGGGTTAGGAPIFPADGFAGVTVTGAAHVAAEVTLAGTGRPAAASGDADGLRAHALMADDVYNDRASPPPGWRVAGEAELQALRLDPQMLQAGDFRARVYATGSGDETRYTIAMRGTRFESLDDWKANAQQAFGAEAAHYRQALEIGERVGRSELAGQVSFTGHSLGGGLASAAAVASGRPADTFNAAGLHDNTIARGEQIRASLGIETRADVRAYSVDGEILTGLQEGGDRVIGGLLGAGLTRTPQGAAAGAFLLDVPEAYGTRTVLDARAPEGTNWFDRNLNPMLPIDRHGMDWVLSSLPR